MKKQIRTSLLLCVCIISINTAPLLAQSLYTENTLKLDSLENQPKAEIEDIAWIAGSWVGEAFGGLSEEIWSDPVAGSMMGMYRSVTRGKVGFYEILTITEENGSLILRLKHFHPDLKGWEEKGVTVDFPLVKVEKNAVWFEGYTFVKESKNEFNVYLAQSGGDGPPRELVFQYTRRKK